MLEEVREEAKRFGYPWMMLLSSYNMVSYLNPLSSPCLQWGWCYHHAVISVDSQEGEMRLD